MSRWPNTFIIGAAKGGTTSLHAYLGRHPQAFMSPVKETHYFADFSSRLAEDRVWPRFSTEDYLALFEGAETYPVVGESSPSYLFDPQAPRRIREAAPDARIVVLLRDPVDRAFSHYLMDVRDGNQERPFFEALLEDWNLESRGWWSANLYIDLGLYATQLMRYYEYFGRDQVGVFLFEDLRADPRALLKEVGAFLGMDLAPFDEMEIVGAYNYYTDPRTDWAWKVVQQEGIRQILRSAIPPRARRWLWNRVLLKPGKKPDPDPQAVGFLKDFYAPQVKTLEALLGRSLPELRQGW